MKTHFFKRGIAGLLSLVMCLSAFIGLGTTTAFAAGEQAEVYLISFPRSGDANLDYSGTWGHSNLHYMNGWYSGESKYTTIRAMHSYDGNICYCIEPGTPQDTGDRYTSKDETFWDNLPSDFNSTISPYDMKLFIGRIMQYGYTGPISTSWRSQNASDAETLAQAMATQVLIWETVVGERDEDFNHISPGSYDAVKSVVSTAHPLYSQFISYYNSIEASVQRHSAMANTGMRVGEITGLRWSDIDLKKGIIRVNHTLVYYNHRDEKGCYFSINTPKTKAGEREIPMTEGVKQAFLMEREFQSQAEISSKSRVDGYDDFIFVNRYGDVQNQGNLNKALRRMMRDCNDEILEKYGADSDPVLLPQFSCHILRHTFATRLCESGANLKFIQSILGHADVSTTMNIYVDVTDALKKKEITAFDDYMTTKLET